VRLNSESLFSIPATRLGQDDRDETTIEERAGGFVGSR